MSTQKPIKWDDRVLRSFYELMSREMLSKHIRPSPTALADLWSTHQWPREPSQQVQKVVCKILRWFVRHTPDFVTEEQVDEHSGEYVSYWPETALEWVTSDTWVGNFKGFSVSEDDRRVTRKEKERYISETKATTACSAVITGLHDLVELDSPTNTQGELDVDFEDEQHRPQSGNQAQPGSLPPAEQQCHPVKPEQWCQYPPDQSREQQQHQAWSPSSLLQHSPSAQQNHQDHSQVPRHYNRCQTQNYDSPEPSCDGHIDPQQSYLTHAPQHSCSQSLGESYLPRSRPQEHDARQYLLTQSLHRRLAPLPRFDDAHPEQHYHPPPAPIGITRLHQHNNPQRLGYDHQQSSMRQQQSHAPSARKEERCFNEANYTAAPQPRGLPSKLLGQGVGSSYDLFTPLLEQDSAYISKTEGHVRVASKLSGYSPRAPGDFERANDRPRASRSAPTSWRLTNPLPQSWPPASAKFEGDLQSSCRVDTQPPRRPSRPFSGGTADERCFRMNEGGQSRQIQADEDRSEVLRRANSLYQEGDVDDRLAAVALTLGCLLSRDRDRADVRQG